MRGFLKVPGRIAVLLLDECGVTIASLNFNFSGTPVYFRKSAHQAGMEIRLRFIALYTGVGRTNSEVRKPGERDASDAFEPFDYHHPRLCRSQHAVGRLQLHAAANHGPPP